MRTFATSTVMMSTAHFGRRGEDDGDTVTMNERIGVHDGAVVVTVSPDARQTGATNNRT